MQFNKRERGGAGGADVPAQLGVGGGLGDDSAGEVGAAFEYALKRGPPRWLWFMHTTRIGASTFSTCALQAGWRRKGKRICEIADKGNGAAMLVAAGEAERRNAAAAAVADTTGGGVGALGTLVNVFGMGDGYRRGQAGGGHKCSLLVSNDDLSITPILPPNSALATVVRDPVERLVSSYRFAVGLGARTAFCNRTSLGRLRCAHPVLGEADAPFGTPEAQIAKESHLWPWTLLGPMMARNLQRRAAAMVAATQAAAAAGQPVQNATIRAQLNSKLDSDPFSVAELVMPLEEFAKHATVLSTIADGQTLALAGLSHLSSRSSSAADSEEGKPLEPLPGIRSKAASTALLSLGKCARQKAERTTRNTVLEVAKVRLTERATFVGLGGSFELELDTTAQFHALMKWKKFNKDAARAEAQRHPSDASKGGKGAATSIEYAQCAKEQNPTDVVATNTAPASAVDDTWASKLLRIGGTKRTESLIDVISADALSAIRESNGMDQQLFKSAKALVARRRRALVDAGRLLDK